jgi:transposase
MTPQRGIRPARSACADPGGAARVRRRGGALVAQQLVRCGEQVSDVPATFSARVRLLSAARPAKSDSHDARSTAIAALHGRRLREVRLEDTSVVLRLLADRRDHLSRERNRTVCRIHNQFQHLRAGGAKTNLTADQVARLLRSLHTDGV